MTNKGRQKYLNKILAPQFLCLKVGCHVMLLRNIGGKLVNGLYGSVKALKPDRILVEFPNIDQTHWVDRYKFTFYDISTQTNVAEREQFPLQLSYGLSIHKSQGMTLDNVAVHCEGIFEAGQLSVAIGRVRHSSGLYLKGFRKGLCWQPKHVVTEFYGKQSMLPSDDVKYVVDTKNICRCTVSTMQYH